MIRILIDAVFIFLIITFELFAQQTKYYDVFKKDTLYYFLSNKGIEILSRRNNSSPFYLIKTIPKTISGSYDWAFNQKYLLLRVSDSLFLYDLFDDLNLILKNKKGVSFTKIYGWGESFLVNKSNSFLILQNNHGTMQEVIDSTFNVVSSSDIFIHPFIVKNGREIYKYVEFFGLYYIYFMSASTDPGLVFIVPLGNDRLLYHIFVPDPWGLPIYMNLRIRKLIPPNFPMIFDKGDWGNIHHNIGKAFEASFKYIHYRDDSNLFTILDQDERKYIQYSLGTSKYRIVDSYIFKLDSVISYSDTYPINFQIITHALSEVEYGNENKLIFSLSQNYPNPFNPSTKIKFTIPSLSLWERVSEGRVRVTLKVFDILGREVAILVDEEKPAGEYEVEFDASLLPSGIYFYRLQSGELVQEKKMILLR